LQAAHAEACDNPIGVGASLGGIASLLALGRAAEEGTEPPFAGLILVDIVPEMDPRGVAHVQGFMRAKVKEGFASIEEAAEAVAAYLPHRPRPKSLDGLKKNLRLHPDGRWHWDPRFLEGPRPVNADRDVVQQALLRATCGLAVPALLVRGGASELVSPEAARAFVEAAPDAEFADVAEACHMWRAIATTPLRTRSSGFSNAASRHRRGQAKRRNSSSARGEPADCHHRSRINRVNNLHESGPWRRSEAGLDMLDSAYRRTRRSHACPSPSRERKLRNLSPASSTRCGRS
jgi:hypothetical protein